MTPSPLFASLAALSLAAAGAVRGETLTAPMSLTASGAPVGVVTADVRDGVVAFTVDLHGLPPGPHGMHLHQVGSCEPAEVKGVMTPAGAAGGHYDPQETRRHLGPEGAGHLGDLPRIEAGADGAVHAEATAPRLHDLAALKGRALIVHAGGDNYSDEPLPLGGGGPRLACGVFR